jgi:iron complex outermembrane receptor protein
MIRWLARSRDELQLLPGALAAGVLAASPLAAAQETSGIEEIFVTAQKREERLQDVPLSVTAFNSEAIRELSVINSTDLAAHTPNLSIGTPVGEGNNPSIVMRGIGLNDFNDNNESNVAVYIDDVYRAALAGQTFQLFDLERVEVLRGPQGTLYGRNTTGGLIHFISKRPTEELEAYANLTLGSYDQVKGEGAISGGTDEIKGRLSVAANEHDGYVSNRAGKDPNEGSSRAWRGQLQIDPVENFTALLNLHGSNANPRAPAYQHQGTAGGGLDVFGYQDTDGDPFAGEYDRIGVLDIENFGTSATLNWDLSSDLALTWITGFENVKKFHQEDTDMQAAPLVEPTFEADSDEISSELRLAGTSERSNWVMGLYYFDYEVESTNTQLDLSNIAGVTLDVDYDQDGDSWAVFGQYEYQITDQWEVALGLRYTDEQKDYQYFQSESFAGFGLLYDFSPATAGELTEIDDDNVSGKLSVNYRPNDDVMIFASVARGFKSGGFNAGFIDTGDPSVGRPPLPLEDVPFDEEKLTAYEIGAKTDWLGGRLRLNGTAFYYDYEDLQALTFEGVSQFISNASDAEVWGAEFELVSQITERLRAQFGLGLLDAEADEINTPSGLLRNRDLVLAPDISADGLVSYDLPLPGGANDLRLQVDFTYRDSHYFDIVNQPVAEQDDYWVFNARAAYRFNDQFEVAAFGKNLFEEEYKVYTFDFTGFFGFNQQFYGPPRWWGVEFRYDL